MFFFIDFDIKYTKRRLQYRTVSVTIQSLKLNIYISQLILFTTQNWCVHLETVKNSKSPPHWVSDGLWSQNDSTQWDGLSQFPEKMLLSYFVITCWLKNKWLRSEGAVAHPFILWQSLKSSNKTFWYVSRNFVINNTGKLLFTKKNVTKQLATFSADGTGGSARTHAKRVAHPVKALFGLYGN